MISVIDIFIKIMANDEFFNFLDHCQLYEPVLYELLNEIHTGYEADCSGSSDNDFYNQSWDIDEYDDSINYRFWQNSRNSSSDEDMYID